MEENFEDAVLNAALIGAAQRVEHYEIAAYGTLCEFAKVFGETEHASLLEETLGEEKETDRKLTELAKEINPQANEEGSQQDESKAGRQSKNSSFARSLLPRASLRTPRYK